MVKFNHKAKKITDAFGASDLDIQEIEGLLSSFIKDVSPLAAWSRLFERALLNENISNNGRLLFAFTAGRLFELLKRRR